MIAFAAVMVGLMPLGEAELLLHLGSVTEQLRGPARLAVAADDSVLVTDPLSGHVARFDASGQLLDIWPVAGGPIGVAIHPDGRVFVSLRDEPKIMVLDSAFGFLGYLGEDEPLVSFVGPTDIDIATDTGRIFVVDAEGDRIYGFNSDGSLALILGSRGIWPSEFIYPSAIAVDEPRNRIIVADHDTCRIQVFTTAGVFLLQFGDRTKTTDGQVEGWMSRPLGLAVDADGHIYVTDALMGTVRVFDPTGIELGKLVEYGYGPGELRVPCDLAVNADGSRLYVVSTNRSGVEIYDLSGAGRYGGGGDDGLTDRSWLSAGEPAGLQDWVSASAGGVTLSGPHLVDARPDVCAPCHGNQGQPGGHGGTVLGQAVLCMSCHNVGGRALAVPIREPDIADPFGTNPMAPDGQGRSHAWGVPAVNPLADSVGPVPGGAMSVHLATDGIIKCATCHNQHSIEHGPSYLRVSNDGDAMCKECHAPRDRGPGDGGSHPVGFAYPEGEDGFPAAHELDPLSLKDGMVECTTCHGPHGADSGGANGGDGDGMLLRKVNDDTLCQTCHTGHATHEGCGDYEITCRDCHDVHDPSNQNAALIAAEIEGTWVTFVQDDAPCGSQWDFVHGVCDPPSYDGICEVCHTETDNHRNNPTGNHDHNTRHRCTVCHQHASGFMPFGWSCGASPGVQPDGLRPDRRSGRTARPRSEGKGIGLSPAQK